MAIRRAGLDQTLARHGVAPGVLEGVRQAAEKQGIPFREAVARDEAVDDLAVARALSEISGLPVVEELDPELVDIMVVRRWPHPAYKSFGLLPLYLSEGLLVAALGDLMGMRGLDELRMATGHTVRPVLMPAGALSKLGTLAYEKSRESASAVLEDADEEEGSEDEVNLDEVDLIDGDDSDAVIIRFVNAVIAEAIKERASDIHIEPFEKDLVVRFRVDGVLHEKHNPPARFKNSIVSRIKIMAGLNIAEKRLPQDGRIRRRMAGREIDFRVSTVPVRHGERVVMRILEKGEVFSLDRVGMSPEVVDHFRELIRQPHGILLVCGPTGSGKSTTLYSAISEINSPDKNILTIEDPVEYELRGIGQVQVNHKINLTFASALRSFLRQDPDVILVGEIRDGETAENATNAALTGHLVFSTIHTNDSAGAFTRLVKMGTEPFLVADTLLAVLAQRLLRRLCPHCKEQYTPSDDELAELDLTRAEFPGTAYRPVGCKECGNRGYSGRVGIFELMPATDAIKQLLVAGRDAGAIKKEAIAEGMLDLREDGLRKVAEGTTSFQEVLRVTREDSMEA